VGPKGAEILGAALVGNSTLEMLSLAENQICNMNEQVRSYENRRSAPLKRHERTERGTVCAG